MQLSRYSGICSGHLPAVRMAKTPRPSTEPPLPLSLLIIIPEELTLAGIGIDIEEIAALPQTTDFRKEEFYKMNFTPGEMAYCILQPDPYSSFAGLFAAKEAMVKADGANRNKTFNTLEIDHSPEGKPLHPDYSLSISHAGGMALAVAASQPDSQRQHPYHRLPHHCRIVPRIKRAHRAPGSAGCHYCFL